jgi:hypothetical protein
MSARTSVAVTAFQRWTSSVEDLPGIVGAGMTRARLRPATASSPLPEVDLDRGETKTVGRAALADFVIDHASLMAFADLRTMP